MLIYWKIGKLYFIYTVCIILVYVVEGTFVHVHHKVLFGKYISLKHHRQHLKPLNCFRNFTPTLVTNLDVNQHMKTVESFLIVRDSSSRKHTVSLEGCLLR